MPASLYGPDGLLLSLQAQITELAANMPTPASGLPKGVADSSATGPDLTKYEPAGHVHASKARKQIVSTSAATYIWVYPTAFASGVVPICNGIAQCPVGTVDLVNVQIDGVPTNTQCVFKITRYTQGLVGLVGGVLAVNPTPLAINLHMSALEP